MARMIPPFPPTSTASLGEREVFRRLQQDKATDNWIVLHSLDVANHSRQVSGEIDFVILIPGKGLLCVEVKGCTRLHRSRGLWYYGTDSQPDPRGPFKQVATSMHSLRRSLLSQQPSLSGILCWTVVIFPYIPFATHAEEWHAWQVIDQPLFTAHPLNTLLLYVLDEARSFVQSRASARWFHPERAEPTPSQCRAIAELLRPNFEFFESPRSRAERAKSELKYYTTEQFAALDAMEVNPRVLFCGPAGTGKTMLAIEAARRSREQGRKVLLLCYNRLLGKWLAEQVAELSPQVKCLTLHSYMLALSGLSGGDLDQHFWHTILPNMAESALIQTEGDVFDELVVDEAQDVLRDVYLDVLDLSLRGGLANGRWRFFGDFEKQMIYRSANLPVDQFLQNRAGRAPIYALRTNCRNTPRIAELVHLLAKLSPRYTKVLRPDNRVEPQLIYYSSPSDQQQLFLTTLGRLYAEGFESREIVVLSPRSSASCTAAMITRHPWKERLQPIEEVGHGQIGYCSIHAFKGLEAEVVIVTDIDRISEADALPLFYIAITRALHRLILFMHEQVKKDIGALLRLPEAPPIPGKAGK